MGRPRCTPPGAELPCGAAAGRGGGAVYTGRGPVCGIITLRAGGAVGSGVELATACGACGSAADGAAATGAGVDGAGAAIGGGTAAAGGFATTGATGACDAIAGRGGAAATAPAGGLATTGPAGGRAAIAGGAMICGACRGWGTIRRGAGRFSAADGVAETAGAVGGGEVGFTGDGCATGGGAVATAEAVVGAAGRTTGAVCGGATAVGRGVAATTGRGADAAWRSAAWRSWIARNTSPGFDTRERSMLGRGSLSRRAAWPPPPRLPPRVSAARTRSASSASSELECVFFSVTPTAVSTSRMALLFTSSSRAKSLIRTLLIRPFCVPSRNRSHTHSHLGIVG